MSSEDDSDNPFATFHQDEEEVVTQPQKEDQQHHLKSIDSTIVIRSLPSQGIPFQIWPAATTLVTLLENFHQQPNTSPLSSVFDHLPRPLRVLELGSGTGLVGIAAAAILGAEVTITDLPHVVSNLQFNASANTKAIQLHGGTVNVCSLRWGEADDLKAIGEFDIVLGSDLVYHDHLFDPLLKTLRGLLSRERSLVFVLAHLRRWKKDSVFFKKAKKMFEVQNIHTAAPADGSRIGVVVYSFVGKPKSEIQSPHGSMCSSECQSDIDV